MRFKSRSRALAVAALSASVGLAGLTLAAAPAQASEPTDVVRVAGTTRYGTAAEAATQAYPSGSTNVVLASGEKFPDALAGGGLAGSLDAPILLAQLNAVPAETQAALVELGADNITILGGTEAISAAVESGLEAAGFTVDRVGGEDRFETALLIAEELGGDTAVLANGLNFPDALAISPGTHKLDLPLLLTTANELHPDAAAFLGDDTVDNVIIVGGTAVVSQAIEDALEADGKTVTRLAGATRYETSVAIAEFHTTVGFTLAEVTLATGEKFPDALAGGPYASQMGAPMVLTQTNTLTPATAAFLTENCQAIDTLHILGGTLAVSAAVEAAAADAAQCAAGGGTYVPATVRPELVSASIVQTTTQGTTVRYTFDEALTGTSVTTPGLFHVYNFGSTAGPAASGNTAQIDPANSRSVLVTFTGINTAALASQLSLATVDEAAVRGLQGTTDTNIIGDAPLNAGGTTQLSAGVTAAPDLVSVGNFRANPANVNETLVDFTFGEAAFNRITTGYHLVYLDGVTDNSAGSPVAGNGTTVHTVAFQNNAGSGAASTVTITSAARGTVDLGTVSDASTAGNLNPLQSADVANGGNSETPDLVSAIAARNQANPNFGQPGQPATIDAILYTFDEPVLEPTTPTLFKAYTSAGGGELSGQAAQRSTQNDTQVVVVFGAGGTLDLVVGASVYDGAVREGTGTQFRPNQQDEVSLANVGTGPTTVAGRTAAPDLTGVSVAERRDAFGTLIGARVTYTFDEDVVLLDATRLKIVLADGTQYTCATNPSPPASPTVRVGSTEDTDNMVSCDIYSTGATTTQILSAVVGVVDDGAVANQAANTGPGTTTAATAGSERNPEGAERISGSTGTPAT